MRNSKALWRALSIAVPSIAVALLVGVLGRSVSASSIGQIAYNLVQNAGTPLTQRTTINCTGILTCSDSGGLTLFNVPAPAASATQGQVTLVVGATDIGSTGTKACSTIENAATLIQAHLISDLVPTGANLAVDVKTVAFGSYTGFAAAASITGGNIPTITTVAANPRYEDLALLGWTTAVAAKTVVCVAITTAPTGGSTSASLTLKYTIP